MKAKTFWDNWIQGWIISRQIKEAQGIESGYRFALNDWRREFEWLLFSDDNLNDILPRVSNKDYLCVTHLKTIPQGWQHSMTADMMICENLSQQAVTLPENLTIQCEETEQCVAIKVLSGEECVCQGQAGFYNRFVIYDMIATMPNFRRQGFGKLIMALLTEKAVQRRITKGLLCASEMGKPLYLTLGWQSIGQYIRIVREDYRRESPST